jgi:hypothetical protein
VYECIEIHINRYLPVHPIPDTRTISSFVNPHLSIALIRAPSIIPIPQPGHTHGKFLSCLYVFYGINLVTSAISPPP